MDSFVCMMLLLEGCLVGCLVYAVLVGLEWRVVCLSWVVVYIGLGGRLFVCFLLDVLC